MGHLSSAKTIKYLDMGNTVFERIEVSKHLDACTKCRTKLRDFALLSIMLELITISNKKKEEEIILIDCIDTNIMLDLVEESISSKERKKSELHLKTCKYCQKDMAAIYSLGLGGRNSIEVSKVRKPKKIVETLPRYFALYTIARLRNKSTGLGVERKVSIIDVIGEILFPKPAIMIPLSFAKLIKRDTTLYRELIDDELITACKQGDDLAWFALEDRFRMYAYKIINEFNLEQEKQDIWNESLNILFTKIHEYEERGKLKYFIRKIIINRCRIWHRKFSEERKKIERRVSELKIENIYSDPLDRIIQQKDVEHLLENIKKMPSDFSSVLLKRLSGMTDNEIAQMLNISPTTVRTRRYRAKEKLFEIKRNDADFISRFR